MKITAPILALAALALIHAAPSADAKQIQPMERRGSGALSESFAAAAVSKRNDGPATSFAGLKKRDDDVNTEGGHDGDDDGDDYDEDYDGDDDVDGDDGGEYEEANPLMKRGDDDGDDEGHGGHKRHCRRVCYKRCWRPHHGHHKKRADEGEVKTNRHRSHCRYYCRRRCWGGGHH